MPTLIAYLNELSAIPTTSTAAPVSANNPVSNAALDLTTQFYAPLGDCVLTFNLTETKNIKALAVISENATAISATIMSVADDTPTQSPQQRSTVNDGEDASAQQTTIYNLPTHDISFLLLNNAAATSMVQFNITGGSNLIIRQIWAGDILTMPVGARPGYTPPNLNLDTRYSRNVSRAKQGGYAGVVVDQLATQLALSYAQVKAAWIESNWQQIHRHLASRTIWIVPDDSKPNAYAYGWAASNNDPQPARIASATTYNLSLNLAIYDA